MTFAGLSETCRYIMGVVLMCNLVFIEDIVKTWWQVILCFFFPGMYTVYFWDELSNKTVLIFEVYVASLLISIVSDALFAEEKTKKRLIKKLKKLATQRYKHSDIANVEEMEKQWWRLDNEDLEKLLKIMKRGNDE